MRALLKVSGAGLDYLAEVLNMARETHGSSATCRYIHVAYTCRNPAAPYADSTAKAAPSQRFRGCSHIETTCSHIIV